MSTRIVKVTMVALQGTRPRTAEFDLVCAADVRLVEHQQFEILGSGAASVIVTPLQIVNKSDGSVSARMLLRGEDFDAAVERLRRMPNVFKLRDISS